MELHPIGVPASTGEPKARPAARIQTSRDRQGRKAWTRTLAQAISQIGSPPVLSTALLVVCAWTLATPRAWMWAGIYVSVAVLAPLFYLAWLVRQGRVTDLDVQLREQRARPMLFALACGALGCLALMLGGAPALLVTLAGALWLQMAVILGITLHWKISVHCATAAAAATALLFLQGTPWPLLAGVPLVAWSRVRLGRHTVLQTIAGALLGAAILGGVLLLVH